MKTDDHAYSGLVEKLTGKLYHEEDEEAVSFWLLHLLQGIDRGAQSDSMLWNLYKELTFRIHHDEWNI